MKQAYLVKTYRRASGRLAGELARALPGLLPSLAVTRTSRREGADLAVDVRTPSGRKQTLCIGVSGSSAPGRIHAALQQLKASRRPTAGYPVLAARFLSPRSRELCREAGIGYVDLAGNCRLHFEGFYYEKVIEKNPFPQRGRPASLFSPASSRLVRVLLDVPARTWRIGELAGAAQVSLGHTSNVCRRLLAEGYADTVERRVRLAQPAKLLEAWREAYAVDQHTLMPYYSFEREPETLMRRIAQVARERGWRYAITSFAAASLLAPFVHGVGMVQWYVEDEAAASAWVQALDLRPAESGPNVVLVIPHDPGVFIPTQEADGVTLVSTAQLYLDLYNGPARGREQAEFLRKERLGF